jgi:hypothetical protein
MKINPSLFSPNATPLRQSGDVSEARRAFEAMLSASAARTRATQAPALSPDSTLVSSVRQTARVELTEPEGGQAPLTRPGRVLDIRV